jgi:predicted nuclease with RNAse H fold
MKLVGIDFGAKLAGTTVIATIDDIGSLTFQSSGKKQDADIFLINAIEAIQPDLIAIDAPLSLPLRYKKEQSNGSFFYRFADIETGAMSPMFLGGLTARAMQLHSHLLNLNVKIIEAYPGHLAKTFKFPDAYKKENQAIEVCFDIISKYWKENITPIHIKSEIPENWHQLDALLALTIAFRFHKNIAKSYGMADEGLIWS